MENPPVKRTKVSKLKEELWLVQFKAHIIALDKSWSFAFEKPFWVSTVPTEEVIYNLIKKEMDIRRPFTRNKNQKYPISPKEWEVQKIIYSLFTRIK